MQTVETQMKLERHRNVLSTITGSAEGEQFGDVIRYPGPLHISASACPVFASAQAEQVQASQANRTAFRGSKACFLPMVVS